MQSSDCSDELLEKDEILEGVISPRCLHGSSQDDLDLHLSNTIASPSLASQRPNHPINTIEGTSSTVCSGNSGSVPNSQYDYISCIQETPEVSPIITTKYFENKSKHSLNYLFPALSSQGCRNDIIPGTDSDMLQYLNEREKYENISVRPKSYQNNQMVSREFRPSTVQSRWDLVRIEILPVTGSELFRIIRELFQKRPSKSRVQFSVN